MDRAQKLPRTTYNFITSSTQRKPFLFASRPPQSPRREKSRHARRRTILLCGACPEQSRRGSYWSVISESYFQSKSSSGPRLTYLEPQGKIKAHTLESLHLSVWDARKRLYALFSARAHNWANGSSFYDSEASACSRSASRSSMSSIPAEYRTSPGGMPAAIISSSVHSTWLVTAAGPTTVST